MSSNGFQSCLHSAHDRTSMSRCVYGKWDDFFSIYILNRYRLWLQERCGRRALLCDFCCRHGGITETCVYSYFYCFFGALWKVFEGNGI